MRTCGPVFVLATGWLLTWCVGVAEAGDALVTKVRRSKVTINQGADAGLTVGLDVSILRPAADAIIHPETGENMGAVEVEVSRGTISKTSARSATVNLSSRRLLPVEVGYTVRYVTVEEEMLSEQDANVVQREQAQQERQQIKSEVSKITRSLGKVQGDIGTLRKALRRLDRIEDAIKIQINSINSDIEQMQGEIRDLQETVAIMGAAPVLGPSESPGLDLENEEDRAQIEQVVREVVQDEIDKKEMVRSPPELAAPALSLLGEQDILEITAEEESFWSRNWYWFLILGIGVVGVAAYFLYMKFMAGEEEKTVEDVEDEADEVVVAKGVEVGEVDLEEIEVEEEDDIVVEETAG